MGIDIKTRDAELYKIDCYECPQCYELHEDEDDAQSCCSIDTKTMYKCNSCGKIHRNPNIGCCVEEYKICTQCGCETHLDRCCEELFQE